MTQPITNHEASTPEQAREIFLNLSEISKFFNLIQKLRQSLRGQNPKISEQAFNLQEIQARILQVQELSDTFDLRVLGGLVTCLNQEVIQGVEETIEAYERLLAVAFKILLIDEKIIS